MTIITKTSSNSLFPGNNREEILNTESKCILTSMIISTGLIGARILKQMDKLPISDASLNVVNTVGLITSTAILLGGTLITRSQLPPAIDASNTLTKGQIVEFISRAKTAKTVKLLSEGSANHLNKLLSLLEEADPKDELVYFPTEDRHAIVDAVRELEGVEKRAKTKEEIQGLRQKLGPFEKRFTVEEFEDGENLNVGPSGIIKRNKNRRPRDVETNDCADKLKASEEQLKGLGDKADIGPEVNSVLEKRGIHFLVQGEQRKVVRVGSKVGGLRRSPTSDNLHQ